MKVPISEQQKGIVVRHVIYEYRKSIKREYEYWFIPEYDDYYYDSYVKKDQWKEYMTFAEFKTTYPISTRYIMWRLAKEHKKRSWRS